MCIRVYVYSNTCVCAYVCMCTVTRVYVHTCVCVHVCMCMSLRVCAYVYVYVYTCVCVRPPLLLLLLLLLMSTQKVQVGGQFKKTKVTCHHVPLREHVQEASCGGVQDMRRRGPYGQDVWSH